jgi:hypothetical protein
MQQTFKELNAYTSLNGKYDEVKYLYFTERKIFSSFLGLTTASQHHGTSPF